VGLGASLGFPLTISAASDTGPDAPKRVSVVAITGYLAFLVGPPLLGFLGEHFGLRSAMMVVLGLVMVAALVARAVAKPQLNLSWRTVNEHQTDCGRHGWHLLKRCQNLQPPALPAQYQRMREQNIRFVVASGNQYYQLISFFPEIAHEIAFVAENGGWVVSAGEDVFNCQLPKDHFNTVIDYLQTLTNIEIIACGKRSAYTLNRYNDELKTVAAKYYHRLNWWTISTISMT
jgi:MFS family permease